MEEKNKSMTKDELYNAFMVWREAKAEPLDEQKARTPMVQRGRDGMLYPCPMPVQAGPSPLEVALRLMVEDQREEGRYMKLAGYVERAFALIDAVKAEEARRQEKQ